MEGTPQLLKGINYGTYAIDENHLIATKDNKTLMKIPLNKVSNSSVVNKQDVTMEIQAEEIGDDDVLTEIRFYIPPNADEKEEKEEVEEEKEGEDAEKEDKDKPKEKKASTADVFNAKIMEKANISQTGGDSIVSFSELPFIVPRGKYSCDLSGSSLRMHGSTFNHIIQYKNISKAFLLPKPDDVHMYFVLGLDKPVRQGNTSYPHLVMQIRKDTATTDPIKVRLTPEQLSAQYDDKLKEEYEGDLYDIIAKIFKTIVKVNIVIPGDFQSSTKHSGVKCSIRASEGQLFFLTKSVIFVPKPVIYIKCEDLKSVEFHRLGSGAQIKLFDMTLITKNGQKSSFSGIDKKELEIIMEYFNSKKISIRTVKEFNNINEDLGDDESDDEDVKAGSLDDEDEEDDEDFIAGEEDDDDDDFDEGMDEEEDEEKSKTAKKK